jgi:hypothetical protein
LSEKWNITLEQKKFKERAAHRRKSLLPGLETSPQKKDESPYEEIPDPDEPQTTPKIVMIEEDYFKADPLEVQESQFK